VDAYRLRLQRVTQSEIRDAKIHVDRYIAELESRRSADQVFFHADLDAFYCSVEALDDPSLIGTAFAVGGSIRHGVLATSSYEARKFGVRAGMAVFIALKLCPTIRIVECHFDRYTYFSKIVKGIFEKYDPHFVSLGLDEATLNLTDYLSHSDMTAGQVAEEIRQSVAAQTGLTISVGIAPTPQMAKIAGNVNKPNGYFEIGRAREEIIAFLNPLPVRKVPGIGGVREQILKSLGFETIGDIMSRREHVWYLFSPKFREFIFPAALGVNVESGTETDQQSISKERTFDPTDSLAELSDMVTHLSQSIAKELARRQLSCRNIGIKLKRADFQNFSRSVTFEQSTANASEIATAAIKLLVEHHRANKAQVRLIGVRVANLVSAEGHSKQKRIGDCFLKMNQEFRPGVPAEPRDAPMQEWLGKGEDNETTEERRTGLEQWLVKGEEAEMITGNLNKKRKGQRTIEDWAIHVDNLPASPPRARKLQRGITYFFQPIPSTRGIGQD
jgi:DNA polymerase kappa